MKLRCTQCLSEVHDRTGYETPTGEALCGPCYFALWGPKGRHALSATSEERRPLSRQPQRGPTIWTPGPLGDLDERPGPKRSWRRRG